MTDEVTPAPETPDTPIEAAPVEDTQPVPVNWKDRYDSIRPEFDRKSQRLAELEAEREQWLASQQEEEPEYDDEMEYEFEDSTARRELAEIKALLKERDEQAAASKKQQEDTTHIDDELTALEKEFDDEFTDEEANILGNLALSNRDEHGNPDVRAAYELFFSNVLEGRKQKWTSSKKKASKPAAGPGAVEVPDLSTAEGRIAYANELARQAEDG